MHLSRLIIDLALILAVAGAAHLLFTRLKQPVVLGYILSGFVVGPGFDFFPSIADTSSINTWSEIGVIVLLFSLGLEFSFKKLLRLGGSALIAGVFEVSAMLFCGYLMGRLLGWTELNSLFLGGIIAISSTTIILRAFDELDLKKRKFAALVTGILIVEDLVAVLLIVFLSTISVSRQFDGVILLENGYKLVIFLSIWFMGGIFILPSFFRWSKKWMSEESLLLLNLALCFLMVVFAYGVGFSPALGAFVMGSLLAETEVSERVEQAIKPLKILFGAIFFVSVGMLLEPLDIAQNAPWVLGISLLVVLGKALFVTLGALAGGQALKQSMQAGFTMTQIGEFSFIIAAIGQSLKVTNPQLYPIAVGVSILTAFVTPYSIRWAQPMHDKLLKLLPPKVLRVIDRYSSGAQSIRSVSHWKEAIRAYVRLVFIQSLLILGVVFMSHFYLNPLLQLQLGAGWKQNVISLLIQLACISPFLWALMVRPIESNSYRMLWLNENYNKGPLLLLAFLRIIIGILLVGFMIDRQFSAPVAFTIALGTVAVGIILFSRRAKGFYHRLENRFLVNYHEKEKRQARRSGKTLIPWDAHLATLNVRPENSFVGHTLEELGLRESMGINVALIERGELIMYAPNKSTRLFPGDRLAVIGTDVQIDQFAKWMNQSVVPAPDHGHETDVVLEKIVVDAAFPYLNQSIRASQIREHTQGLVVGLERNGERILNPESLTLMQLGDVLWLVGSKIKIDGVLKKPHH